MRRNDFFFFLLGAGLLLALLWPACWKSDSVPANFGDLYAYHYPLRHLAVSSLQTGRMPFWNAFIFCGLPLSANSQAALFYPVSILGTLLPLSLALSWDFAFHWIWGGLGLMLLAKRNGLDGLGAAFCAALYCLSPFLIYRIVEGIPTLLASLAWAPWCWLALQSGRGGLLAAAWSLQFFSGHPQFMVVNAAAMAAWALSLSSRRVLLGRFFLEGLFALALTGLQWAPTLEFLSLSVRKNWSSSFNTAYSLAPKHLATWLNPNALGNPLDNTFADVPSVFFESCGVFIGVAGAALAVVGLYRGLWRAAALILLGLFFGFGGHNPIYREILQASALSFLRTPARYSFLCLWGLILAAGAGLRWSQGRLAPWLRLAVALAAVAELVSWDKRFLGAQSEVPFLTANPAIAAATGGRPLRVMTDPDLANQNKTMLYRAMNVNGYEAFYLGGYPGYAARSEGQPAADASRSYLRRYQSPEMNLAGVAFYISSSGKLEPNASAYPLAYFVAAAGAPLRRDAPAVFTRSEKWRVWGKSPREPGEKLLALAQPYYPGWRAWFNGVPIPLQPWNGFFQAVAFPSLPPGSLFELRLQFKPTGWLAWVAAAILAWSAWFGLWRKRLRAL